MQVELNFSVDSNHTFFSWVTAFFLCHHYKVTLFHFANYIVFLSFFFMLLFVAYLSLLPFISQINILKWLCSLHYPRYYGIQHYYVMPEGFYPLPLCKWLLPKAISSLGKLLINLSWQYVKRIAWNLNKP